MSLHGSLFTGLCSSCPSGDGWGPSVTSDPSLNGAPYAPYSKGDKLGRMADWTVDGKDREGRGGRMSYGRGFRDQQVYGAGQGVTFHAPSADDETAFSVVSNNRDSFKSRGHRGAAFLRGRGQRGGRNDGRPGRMMTRSSRGNPLGLAGPEGRSNRPSVASKNRRFGWKDYDKQARSRDASINIRPEWKLIEEIDFNRLGKLHLEVEDGQELDNYGFLYYYDRTYDKQTLKNAEKKLVAIDRATYNVTTSSDPIIQELSSKGEATIFATDSILSMLMCATRSVYPWDIVLTRQGTKLFIDKRDNATLDLVTVNENAADYQIDGIEGNKDAINQPAALSEEATYINHNFANQVVLENTQVSMAHENPFYNASDDTDPPASKAYKYRRFDLSTSEDDNVSIIVRTEIDALQKNAINGEDQYLTLKALNEFDSKSLSSTGSLDWRTKLVSHKGAVVATEMKNNSCKLARWTVQSLLAQADIMKLGFVSRVNPRLNDKHVILGVMGWKPRDFASQMNLYPANGWGIVRTVADMCFRHEEGRFVLVKDPNKPVLRLYFVPVGTYEDEEPTDA